MKLIAAAVVFSLFAFFIGWGILMLIHGSPWLFIAALLVFFGTFIKFGCLSH